jgi:hypothetical protein
MTGADDGANIQSSLGYPHARELIGTPRDSARASIIARETSDDDQMLWLNWDDTEYIRQTGSGA